MIGTTYADASASCVTSDETTLAPYLAVKEVDGALRATERGSAMSRIPDQGTVDLDLVTRPPSRHRQWLSAVGSGVEFRHLGHRTLQECEAECTIASPAPSLGARG